MSSNKKRILVLGCGFSGIAFILKINELAKKNVDITLVEPRINVDK